MLKKVTQTLLLVFSSFFLFISVTVSAHAQSIVSGTIRWKKDYGVIPMGPGHKQAAALPCGQFFAAALDVRNNNKPVTYTSSVSQGPDEGNYYVCRYSMKVPPNKSLYIIAGMGGVLLLPKMDRSSYYWTDSWIGGSRPRPPAGYERGFTGYKYVTLTGRRRVNVNFEMLYVSNGDPR